MIYLLKHCISIATIDNRYNTTQAKEMVMEWGWFMALCLPHCQEVIWKNSFSTQIGKGWKGYWVNPLRYPWLSMDWFKGRITANHGFSDQIWGSPVNVPLHQSIDIISGLSGIALLEVHTMMGGWEQIMKRWWMTSSAIDIDHPKWCGHYVYIYIYPQLIIYI